MTVSSQTNNATFVGNGVTTVFPLPFRFFSNGDVFAYFIDPITGASTPMVLGTDYTLAGAAEPEVNGNAVSVLTTTAPLANGRGLYVERIMQEVQSTDIVNQGEFFASTHEDVFDRLTMLIQQANAKNQGAIRVAIGDPEPARLAPIAQRAGKLMGFDANGNPIATDLAAADPQKFTFNQPQTGGFFSNSPTPARIHRMADRVFFGGAVKNNGRSDVGFSTPGQDWLTNSYGAAWLMRGATVGALTPDSGGIFGGIFGARASHASVAAGGASIGIGGICWQDSATNVGWAGYLEATREAGTQTVFGLELAIKNKGDNAIRTPYNRNFGGTVGIWFAGGGDPTYAGAPTNPCNTAIAIGKNGHTWNKGIVFDADGLTGTDGFTGSATAIDMARGHTIRWMASNTDIAVEIRSVIDSGDATRKKNLTFNNDTVFLGSDANNSLFNFSMPGNAVNGLQFSGVASGGPVISAAGPGADINLIAATKGAGNFIIRNEATVNSAFGTSFISFGGNSGAAGEVLRVTRLATSVNYLNASGGASGTPPSIAAAGTDTNIDLLLAGKGTGTVRFGAFTSNADAPVNGYITIKDAAGTLRKLATIA